MIRRTDGTATRSFFPCVVSATRPEKTLAEIIAAAKAEPKKWNFAISSLGSAGHLATIEFLRRTGKEQRHGEGPSEQPGMECSVPF